MSGAVRRGSAQMCGRICRPPRSRGATRHPVVFFIAAVALTVNLWMVRPVRSSLGLAVILARIPFFHYWRKFRPSAAAEHI